MMSRLLSFSWMIVAVTCVVSSPGASASGQDGIRVIDLQRPTRAAQVGLIPGPGEPLVISYPSLTWPLAQPLGEGTYISNYVDNDQGTPSLTDYMGGHDHLYDDHRGTDIAVYNFRLMDRGVAIVAAAAGRVLNTTFHFGDRNTATPYPDGGNGLSIEHDDGSVAYYWHVRTSSVMVEPGERVDKGQPIAFVGSSGWTPIPHLHFELSGARDPWEGTYQALPSLWDEQPDYVGDAPLWVMDMGIFTLDAVGGSITGITDRALKERISEPAIVGSTEEKLHAWVQVQGNSGDRFDVEVIDPYGAIVDRTVQGVSRKTRYGWFVFEMDLAGERPEGSWTIRVVGADGTTLMSRSFEVGMATAYPPRFRPVAGQSVRLGGSDLETTLDAGAGQLEYHLVDAPSNVSLDGSLLRIEAASAQSYRSHFFQVVATDQMQRTDTLWYHLVDPARPPNPADTSTRRDAVSSVLPVDLHVGASYPNPVRHHGTLEIELAAAGIVRVTLVDMLGRNVQAFERARLTAGRHAIRFELGHLASGLYAYRIEHDGRVRHVPVTVLQ